MAVAALSTSAIALTASPTPQPATQAAPEGAQAFSKLVAQAKPDDASAQGKPGKGGSPEAEVDAAADEILSAPAAEGETTDAGADKPLDLLSEIEAMVAAANQITVAPQPATPAPAVVAKPQTETASEAPVAVGGSAAKPIVQAAAASPTALPSSFAKAAAPLAARPAPADRTAATMAPSAASTDGSAPVVTDEAAPVAQAPAENAEAAANAAKPARGNIATLLASLKSAFTQGKAIADAPDAPEQAAPIAIDTPPLANAVETPAPAPAATPTTPPAAAAVPASAAKPAQAPVETAAPIVTAEAAMVSAPRSGKPTEAKEAKAAVALNADATARVAEMPSRDVEVPARPTDAAPASVIADAAQPAPVADTPAIAVAAPVIDPAAAGVQSGAAAANPAVDGAALAPADQTQVTVDRHLDLARDTQWLDRLARDISQAATREGHLKFHLNPEHLGALTVEIANSAAGTAIKLTTETDQARTIIADAQPQLLAEVRAQGLRVSETHVELNNQQQGSGNGSGSTQAQAQNQQGQPGQQRQPSADSQPFGRRQAASRDDAGDSAPQDNGELYA